MSSGLSGEILLGEFRCHVLRIEREILLREFRCYVLRIERGDTIKGVQMLCPPD